MLDIVCNCHGVQPCRHTIDIEWIQCGLRVVVCLVVVHTSSRQIWKSHRPSSSLTALEGLRYNHPSVAYGRLMRPHAAQTRSGTPRSLLYPCFLSNTALAFSSSLLYWIAFERQHSASRDETMGLLDARRTLYSNHVRFHRQRPPTSDISHAYCSHPIGPAGDRGTDFQKLKISSVVYACVARLLLVMSKST